MIWPNLQKFICKSIYKLHCMPIAPVICSQHWWSTLVRSKSLTSPNVTAPYQALWKRRWLTVPTGRYSPILTSVSSAKDDGSKPLTAEQWGTPNSGVLFWRKTFRTTQLSISSFQEWTAFNCKWSSWACIYNEHFIHSQGKRTMISIH